ncbi:YjfI family protein [Sinobacterium caligoides]|nr:YjfI family protein [Sinobacterium caligoides]
MKAKSSAHYQREYRKRLRDQGLVKKEVWILPENAKQLAVVEKQFRRLAGEEESIGVSRMTDKTKNWTTNSLYEALQEVEIFVSGEATVELIDGVSPALHVIMTGYGDLPIFVTVVGDQIIAEAMLWSVAEVADVALFNEAVLKTHKYFPLSTISLDRIVHDSAGHSSDFYHMFGALSSTSILPNIVFEIETLASNVIHATEAYSEFLSIPVEAS